MENSRPQLNLADLTRLRWLLGGVLGLLSAWTVFYMEVDVVVPLAIISILVPLFTWRPGLSAALPPWVHRLAFPLIVMIFVFDWWQNREPLPAMIRLDLMLLAYRCISPRGRREDLQLILLALFAVVVTGVFTVSIAFVLQILLFSACALALLLAVTIADARSGDALRETAGWEKNGWREFFARLKRVSDWRVVSLGAALFGGVVGLSVVLFMTIPRFEFTTGFFIENLLTRKSLTGFTENVRFGDVTEIQQDTSMAFAVDVDPALVPAEPYWRMLVLDEYSGEGFQSSASLKQSIERSGERSMIHRGGRRFTLDGGVWVFFFQPSISRYLPLLGGFSQITFGEPKAMAQQFSLRLAMLDSSPAKMVAYRIEGMDTDGRLPDPEFARRFAAGLLPETPAGRFRASPAEINEAPLPAPSFLGLGLRQSRDRQQMADWVKELGGTGEGGLELARRAVSWLQERHSYSLSSTIPAGESGESDPLVRWLGSAEPGHCELFAGGLVLLARAAGVPARMVTGFKGGSWNTLSGGIRVLNSDAHAWCEIWDNATESWVRVDPTPGSTFGPSPANTAGRTAMQTNLPADSSWSARMDGMRIFWYRQVVNFDSASQAGLLTSSKQALQLKAEESRLWIDTTLETIGAWFRSPWERTRYVGLGSVLIALAGGYLVWRSLGRGWWLAWRSRRAKTGRADPVRREAGRWLRQMETVPGRSNALSPETPLAKVQAELLRIRFGERDTWAEPVAVFLAARKELRSARRSGRQA